MKKVILNCVFIYLFSTLTTLVSCQKEDFSEDLNSEDVNSKAINLQDEKTITLHPTYNYKNVKYNEKEWNIKTKDYKESLFYVGLNDNIFVFDNLNEKEEYEKNVVLNKLNEMNRDTNCNSTGEFIQKSKVELYKNTNYNSLMTTLYFTIKVKRNLIGYLSNNNYKMNLSDNQRNQTSSLKVFNLSGDKYFFAAPGIPAYCRNFNFICDLRAVLVEDNNSFTKELSYMPGVGDSSSDNDLTDNKMYRLAPLSQQNCWNDKIKSVWITYL